MQNRSSIGIEAAFKGKCSKYIPSPRVKFRILCKFERSRLLGSPYQLSSISTSKSLWQDLSKNADKQPSFGAKAREMDVQSSGYSNAMWRQALQTWVMAIQPGAGLCLVRVW